MRRRQLLVLSALSTLGLAACGGDASSEGASASDSGGGGESFSFSPEGYDGVTVSLDGPAERIVADYYSAAALAQYGIAPVAVFGYGHDGEIAEAVGEDVEVLGIDGELSIEKLAAAAPDLIIAYGNEDGSGWTWWDEKVTTQATSIAPFLPVKLYDSTPEDMFGQYKAIADALGAETETGPIAERRGEYEAARQRIRDITDEKDWLTVLLVSFGADVNYVAQSLGVASMLADDGVQLVGPAEAVDGPWAEVSWEAIGDYPADVLLIHDYSVAYEENPLFQSLVPVQGDQMGTWDDKRAYTYESYTLWLGELAEVLEGAQDITP